MCPPNCRTRNRVRPDPDRATLPPVTIQLSARTAWFDVDVDRIAGQVHIIKVIDLPLADAELLKAKLKLRQASRLKVLNAETRGRKDIDRHADHARRLPASRR